MGQGIHAGNHLQVMPPHVIPAGSLPAPVVTPEGSFQTLDDAQYMWVDDLDADTYPRVHYPDEDVAHHGAHPRWERYQTATCWHRTGNQLTIKGWYWLNDTTGEWDPVTFVTANVTGTIWHDPQNAIDRFVIPAAAGPAWSVIGWARNEAGYGYIIRWQVVMEDPRATVGKKGGDLGWSGSSVLADPGNAPPPCP